MDYFLSGGPMDGTKEFIKRNDEFTVNIALIENGVAKEGVVYAPALGELFFTQEGKAFHQNDRDQEAKEIRSNPELRPYTIVASRSHLNEETLQYLEKRKEEYKEINTLNFGSSLKICRVAQGLANEYPRLGPTMEWDTGAGHAVAKAAGCRCIRHDNGEELLYNKENLLNPYFIIQASYAI